jgi:uncharacterized membrane protein HdeD (DUF308 family)
VSAKAVHDSVKVLALVMFFIIVLGVVYFFREQFEALGLPWPSALDTTLSVLVGFVKLIMTPPDIRGLIVLIAIFTIILGILGLLLRPGGPGAGR